MTVVLLVGMIGIGCGAAMAAAPDLDPYQRQIAQQVVKLKSDDARVREGAVEALGYLRAWSAADEFARLAADPSSGVRRETAMGLGWVGTRKHVDVLLGMLDDSDWTVRQAAWVALTNLTGMQWPVDALGTAEARRAQVQVWKQWWAKAPGDRAAAEVFELLKGDPAKSLAAGCEVTASSAYKGPANALTDGSQDTFWQAKGVKFPQHCTIDLGAATEFTRLVIHQYGPGYCMTDFGVAASGDGVKFEEIHRAKTPVEPLLEIELGKTVARYVRITSYDSQNKIYPTTIREIEIWNGRAAAGSQSGENIFWRKERGLRALGVFGGAGAFDAAAAVIDKYATRGATDASEKAMVQAGIRALGRLRDARALPLLTALLEQPQWARYAAEALGDLGDDRAVAALVKVYPRYARDLAGKPPAMLPKDDHPGLEPADRMYEIPYAISMALSRLPLADESSRAGVREIAPLILANLQGDFDGAVLYEPEPSRLIAAHLLKRIELLDAAARAALAAVGRNVQLPAEDPPQFLSAAQRKLGTTAHGASWMPVFCIDAKYAEHLIALLEHQDGWVRINAAKALMFMNEQKAVEPIAKILAESKREADYGYFGGFAFNRKTQGQDDYDDPSPRWREAFARALGRLGAKQHVPLLAKLLNDEANALEIQYASATALDEIGTPEAIDALREAEQSHPYHSIALVAREAIWRRGLERKLEARSEKREGENKDEGRRMKDEEGSGFRVQDSAKTTDNGPRTTDNKQLTMDHGQLTPTRNSQPATHNSIPAILFIEGDAVMPNRFQIDPWRQTYSTTDSGPAYRLGRNLCVLKPGTVEGKVIALTHFDEGYIADCEVSWDGSRIVFARRGGLKDPWWHIWEISADGSGLRQITRGPYHDVGPAYMPDGRIIFSSSRIGLRDEYHGYPATGLTIMNAEGGDIHCIGFNLGRDNEPAILPDGRIGFSRLELFYSRLKTEINIEAAYPDGTRNAVLYGPERRDFWQQVTRASGEKWWGEVPPRHRVLRLTQVQGLDAEHLICASTAGLVVVGPGRDRETIVPHDKSMAVTTPFPLGDGRVLCAAVAKKPSNTKNVDSEPLDGTLGIYIMELATGKMELLHADPKVAEFEPRPLIARTPPPSLPENAEALGHGYTARLLCASAQITQEPLVRERGRFVRVVEGQPITGRHANQNSPEINAWKNHTGTLARVLGTVPLASDGSFFVEIPADRLVHVQVLDSDRRVMGNQLVWMYGRPGETKSCIGCHENPENTMSPRSRPLAAGVAPVQCLPTGGEFSYRAKLWNKGILTDESEERTRTVRAVNLMGRQ